VTRAVLSLGSNLGDRAAHLRGAVRGLGAVVISVSGVYQTPPWGDVDQPAYLNAVALVYDVNADPLSWFGLAQRLESEAGRVRDPQRRFGPRTLDIDVIAVWAEDGTPLTADQPELTLPHPRAHLRAFVLRPWLDIEPYAQLPGHGFVHDLLRSEPVASDLAGLRARADISLDPGRCMETEV
jgi:2-amino-4-hydroxy-6-hydroxymethyldihydropteridine diphosphokinase